MSEEKQEAEDGNAEAEAIQTVRDAFAAMNGQRRKLWCDAWLAYTRSSNSENTASATVWADEALKGFDERFLQPAQGEDQ